MGRRLTLNPWCPKKKHPWKINSRANLHLAKSPSPMLQNMRRRSPLLSPVRMQAVVAVAAVVAEAVAAAEEPLPRDCLRKHSLLRPRDRNLLSLL